MNRTLIGGFLALGILTSTAGAAFASKTTIKTKGMDASGAFDVQQAQRCANGSTGTATTSVQISMFETVTTTNGVTTTGLQTSISVSRFDGCDPDLFLFDNGLFQGVGALSMSALQSGTITGNFVLNQGTRLSVNLTLTGSDTTSLGISSRRSILGNVMTLQRSSGSSRTATLSGSVKVDGQIFGAAQMINANGNLARNTGGEITIIKP